MNYDWNWFFSSFCQSAAALIGIIAAFLISRLLGLSEKIHATITQFDNLIIEFNRLTSSLANRRFTWYTKTQIKYDSKIKKAVKTGEFNNLNKEQILEKIYSTNTSVFKIDDAVMEIFDEILEKHKPKKTTVDLGNGMSIINEPISFDLDIIPNGLWDSLNNEKEIINQLEVESRTVIQRFYQNKQDLTSFNETTKPLKIIIIILMIAFPLTVIYPLHFMPVNANQSPNITFNPIIIFQTLFSLKSFLLVIFFFTIEGLFYYFFTLTKGLEKRLLQAAINNADKYQNIKTYSKYLGEA